jgi:hypothetical protein
MNATGVDGARCRAQFGWPFAAPGRSLVVAISVVLALLASPRQAAAQSEPSRGDVRRTESLPPGGGRGNVAVPDPCPTFGAAVTAGSVPANAADGSSPVAPAIPEGDPQGQPPDKNAGQPEKSPWAAGMQAASVGVPPSVAPSGSVEAQSTVRVDAGGAFFAVPIPRSDPTFGAGLVGVAAYIFKLDPKDTETPASTLGAGAFWMDSRSWGGGVGAKLNMKHDGFRLLAGLAYADLRYNLIVRPDATGEEVAIPLSQAVYGGVAHAQFRVANDLYVGARAGVGKITTSLTGENLPEVPPALKDEVDGAFQLNSLGPSFALDTRDNPYYPRAGIALDMSVDIYFGAAGSDISYNHYEANYRQYASVRGRDVLAWQAYLCAAGGSPPFFLECQVGPNSLLRGYSFGRYRGDAMGAVQAEYRWQPLGRWIVAAFGGVTQVGSSFREFNSDGNLWAGGLGARYVVEPKNGVTLRVDYAWGKGETGLYVSVGEAF